MRLKRRLTILVMVLPVVVFLIAAAAFVARQTREILAHLDVILVSEARKQVNRDVQVGSVDISVWGTAVVKDLRIADGPTFEDGTLIDIPRLVVKYHWQDLILRKKAPIQALETIRLESPHIFLERYEDGVLNVSDLLVSKPGPPRPPFLATFYVTNGTLTFRDALAKGSEPVTTKVRKLEGVIDAASAPFYVYSVEARGADRNIVGSLAVSGSIDAANQRIFADVSASDADAAYWMRYLFNLDGLEIASGKANLSLCAARSLSNGKLLWNYSLRAAVWDGSAHLTNFLEPMTGIAGELRVEDDSLLLDLVGSVASSPVLLKGEVSHFAQPNLCLQIRSDKLDVSRITKAVAIPEALKQVSLSGLGHLSVAIEGTAKHPIFSIQAQVPSVQWRNYGAKDAALRATYSEEALQVDGVSADVLGGRVSVTGRVEQSGTQLKWALNGAAKDIPLSAIPQLADVDAKGAASGRFAITGDGVSPVFVADVQVPRGNINALAFSQAASQLSVAGGRVHIDYLSANVAGGTLRAAGDVTQGSIDLNTSAAGIDVANVASAFGVTEYSGVAGVQGAVTGSLSDPQFAGDVEVFNAKHNNIDIDYIRAELTADKENLALKNTILRILPAELVVNGSVHGLTTGDPVFDFDLELTQGRIDKLLSLANANIDATGIAEGQVSIRGPLSDLSADGTVAFSDGLVRGYPLTNAKATFNYSDSTLNLNEVVAESDGARLAASGTIDRKGNLDVTANAASVSSVKFNESIGNVALLSGNIDAHTRITGTLDSPAIAGQIASGALSINTVRFDRFSANADWNAGKILISDVALESRDGTFTIDSAVYDTVQDTLTVDGGTLTKFAYPALYTVVLESPYIDTPEGARIRSLLARARRPLGGVVDASFSARGPLDSLNAQVTLIADEISMGEVKDIALKVAASSDDGDILLENLEASSDQLYLSAHGSVRAKGQTDLDIDAYNIDIGALAPAAVRSQMSGVATVSARLVGDISSPSVMASAGIVNPVFFGITFDKLDAGKITLENDENGGSFIDISGVYITKDGHSGSMYGVLPWNWSTFSVPTDQPLDLHAKLDQQSLSIISVFASAVSVDEEKPGVVSASLDMTGPLSSPALSGQLLIADGEFTVQGIADPFSDVNAKLVFDQDLIRVERLAGKSNAGGGFEVTPGGTVSLEGLVTTESARTGGNFNLAFHIDDLAFTENDMFGYQERVSGSVSTGDEGIVIRGPLMNPEIVGAFGLSHGMVLLGATMSDRESVPWHFAFNPRFNVSFGIQDEVLFRTQSLVSGLAGGGSVGGTLNAPTANATLKIANGTLKLPTNRMRIASGTVTIDWTPLDDAPKVTIDVRAQTSVTTSVTAPTSLIGRLMGGRNRYTIIMNVKGPLDSLQPEHIDLRSEPPGLSRSQILAALGHFDDLFGGGEFAFKEQLKDALYVAVSPVLFDPLEDKFIEALGLDDFEIEYGFEQPLALFISKELFRGLYASYWRMVSSSPSTTDSTESLRLGYRWGDRFGVDFVTDSRGLNIFEASFSTRF